MNSAKESAAEFLRAHLEMLEVSGVSELMIQLPSNQLTEKKEEAIKTTQAVSSTKATLLELNKTVQSCIKCQGLADKRTQTVFGSGSANAELVFVGEAPGYEEDKQGLPFVGEAGQLLTKMIEGIKLKRSDVFICNVLKCRPPGNRNPNPDEVTNCSPYLWAQLEIIKPKLICALGRFAAQTLLKSTTSISQLRGSVHEANGYPVICTYHPAYLLRNPDDKQKAWEDLKFLRREFDRLRPAG